MSIDGGYPRAITIVVPDSIPLRDAGLYVSLVVNDTLDELGTAHVLRRSVNLRFIEGRVAILQFESTQALLISQAQREYFQAAKTAFDSATAAESLAKEASSKQDALSAAAPNRKKQG